MNFFISWVIPNNGKIDGGSSYSTAWEDVWRHLSRLKYCSGSICLDLVDAPDIAPYSLSVAADKGNYLVTLLETTEHDSEVRGYSNPTASAEEVDILGDYWDARQLTCDFEFVCRMVEQFFRTGDVSKNWLN